MSTIRGEVVGGSDFGKVDVSYLVVQSDAQMAAFEGQNLLALGEISGENLRAGDVIGEDADEVGLVLGLEQVLQQLGGDLGERLVGGSEDSEWAGACRNQRLSTILFGFMRIIISSITAAAPPSRAAVRLACTTAVTRVDRSLTDSAS